MSSALSCDQKRYVHYRAAIERPLAAALLVFLAPILGVLAALTCRKIGRPVLFRQVRVGHAGRPFTLIKFRTMVENAEHLGGGYMPPELDLIPPFGKLLRSTSLDELPQLWNVVCGHMSFVGPRPALPDQYERYDDQQVRRVDVQPGITGLAQVRARNNAPWSVRIRHDIEYLETVGPGLDLRILLRTVQQGLTRSGVRHDQTQEEVDDLGVERVRRLSHDH